MRGARRSLVGAATALVVFIGSIEGRSAGAAQAETAPPQGPAKLQLATNERPWAKGVSPERQEAALATFAAGNAAFTESRYSDALGSYREALRLWDHPAIHYNAAVALINLDRPLAAYEHLEASLAYGDAPLGDETERQALLYKRLLSGQLAELQVACAEEGAEVMLDGKTLFRAPGSARQRLLPGAYQLVARKPGYLTETRTLQVPAGKLTRETLVLHVTGVPALHPVRHFSVWKPWAVVGAGALVGLLGVPLRLAAQSNLRTFDFEIAQLCPTGCRAEQLPSSVIATRDRGQLENQVAIGLFAVGAAITVAGAVLVILNQPRLEPDTVAGLVVTPLVAAGTAGMSATLHF